MKKIEAFLISMAIFGVTGFVQIYILNSRCLILEKQMKNEAEIIRLQTEAIEKITNLLVHK